jgi:hypothetical protein
MFTKNKPPVNGLSDGPMIVACQWNMSSPTGPSKIKTASNTILYTSQANTAAARQ